MINAIPFKLFDTTYSDTVYTYWLVSKSKCNCRIITIKALSIIKIKVDRKLCIGAASCLGVAPEAYELDEENIAIIKDAWQELPDDILLASAQACPTKAIFLYNNENKQIFP